LALPVGRAFNDEFERGALQSVDSRLHQQRIGHHGDHFVRGSIACDDRARLSVTIHYQLVEVVGFSGFEPVEGEIIEHEEVDAL
jgi:hypothetical protein